MSFKETSVANRVAVRDGSVKLGNLAQRLTIGSGPVDSPLSAEIDALAATVQTALAEAGYPAQLPSGTAAVKNGDALSVTKAGKTVPAKIAVSGNTAGAVTLTQDTDALASQGDAISIQDRNSVTLLGSGVAARVTENGLVSAYFTGLSYGINADGNPLDITTARAGSTVSGRVRVYVVNNVVKNVYLDGAAALVTGNTVPVQNSAGLNIAAGTVTVGSGNTVTSAKLPSNYTAFADGRPHPVSDLAGVKSTATAKVSNGDCTDQTLPATAALLLNSSTLSVKDGAGKSANAAVAVAAGAPTVTLPGTNAIVADTQVLTVDGGTVTLAIANGAITATYAPTAA